MDTKTKAQKIVTAQNTPTLIETFEMTSQKMDTEKNPNEYLALAKVREWIMDELEIRNAEAIDKWLDGNDESPRAYFC